MYAKKTYFSMFYTDQVTQLMMSNNSSKKSIWKTSQKMLENNMNLLPALSQVDPKNTAW